MFKMAATSDQVAESARGDLSGFGRNMPGKLNVFGRTRIISSDFGPRRLDGFQSRQPQEI
jgi:hypothetical protein